MADLQLHELRFPVRVEWVRANGDCLCRWCHQPYWKHPHAKEKEHLDWEGRPFMHKLCDGLLVKL